MPHYVYLRQLLLSGPTVWTVSIQGNVCCGCVHAACPSRFTYTWQTRIPNGQVLRVRRSRSGRIGVEKNLRSLPWFSS